MPFNSRIKQPHFSTSFDLQTSFPPTVLTGESQCVISQLLVSAELTHWVKPDPLSLQGSPWPLPSAPAVSGSFEETRISLQSHTRQTIPRGVFIAMQTQTQHSWDIATAEGILPTQVTNDLHESRSHAAPPGQMTDTSYPREVSNYSPSEYRVGKV